MKTMTELQKLEVLLLEKYQEPVHLFLCRMGVVQYIKVDWEKEYSGLLNACPLPNEISLENSDIQKRIEKILKELDLNLENGFDEVSPLPGNTFKEILIHINESLTKIEARTSEMELSKVKRNQADFNNQLEETAENVLERLGKEYSEKLHSSPEKKHKADGDLIKEILNLGREADCGPAMMTAALEKPESFTTNILGLVLSEALAIYGLLIAFMLNA
jgi:hypothetical protein